MHTPLLRPTLFASALAFGHVLSAQLSVTLTPVDHNGYHITCFGARDGAIDLSVSGGTPPYTYVWTSGATTQDVSDLAAGFYGVTVTDAAMLSERKEITLTQPADMRYSAVLSDFGGYNISCNSCYNGSISITPTGGVAPYSYLWNDGATSATRSGLGAFNFSLEINDANGCADRSEVFSLTEPQRNDWTMSGNAGTTPGTQFIGTTDNKDVVFKSNNTERLRLLGNGDVKVSSFAATGDRLVYVDNSGILRRAPEHWQMSKTPWYLGGNTDVTNTINRIGTLNEVDLLLMAHGTGHMRITTKGKVGIGTDPPSGPIDGYRLFVDDGIVTRDVLVKAGAWPDYVFKDGYHLLEFHELKRYLKENRHLPGIPSAAAVEAKGGVELGDLQRRMLETIEQQALYILQLEERIKATEERLNALETAR